MADHPKDSGSHRTGHHAGRDDIGGNMRVKRPINIQTSNPGKLQVKSPSFAPIPQHSVTKLAGKFYTKKG